MNGDYKERKFQEWRSGLLYLLIVIFMPIVQVTVYVFSKMNNTFFFTLIITTTVSLIYEFYNSERNCSTILKIENIIVTIDLYFMLACSLALVFYINNVQNATKCSFKIHKSILLILFVIPVITTFIEIVRAICSDLKNKKYAPAETNIVDGARNI